MPAFSNVYQSLPNQIVLHDFDVQITVAEWNKIPEIIGFFDHRQQGCYRETVFLYSRKLY